MIYSLVCIPINCNFICIFSFILVFTIIKNYYFYTIIVWRGPATLNQEYSTCKKITLQQTCVRNATKHDNSLLNISKALIQRPGNDTQIIYYKTVYCWLTRWSCDCVICAGVNQYFTIAQISLNINCVYFFFFFKNNNYY